MVKSRKRRRSPKKSKSVRRRRSLRRRSLLIKRYLDGGWRCEECRSCNFNFDNIGGYICQKCKSDFWKNRSIIWTRGDGYCSIHAVYMSYLSYGGNPYLSNETEPILDPDNLRKSIAEYVAENFESIIDPRKLNVDRYLSKTTELIQLLEELEDLKGKSIMHNVDNMYSILAKMLNIKIHLNYKNHGKYLLSYSEPFVPNDDTLDVYVIGNGIHFSAVVDDKITKFDMLNENTQTYWTNMINEETRDRKYVSQMKTTDFLVSKDKHYKGS